MPRPRPLLTAVLPLALAAALLAGCGGDDDDGGGGQGSIAANYTITGSWNGVLSQEGLPDFAIGAHIGSLEHPPRNRVHYTGIDCGGNWTYLGRAGSAFRFREVINSGEGGECKGVGIVTLTPISADIVRYRFRGGGVVSRGELHRQVD